MSNFGKIYLIANRVWKGKGFITDGDITYFVSHYTLHIKRVCPQTLIERNRYYDRRLVNNLTQAKINLKIINESKFADIIGNIK